MLKGEMELKRVVMNKRAVFLLFIVLTIFFILLSRFVYIQTTKEIKGQDLQVLAEERWQSSRVLKGVRGTIYDRFGDPLAEELKSYTVYAILNEEQPSYVKDPRKTAEKLAPYIDMDVSELERLLSTEGRFQVELGPNAKNLTHERMEQIKSLQLEGIFFREEPRRYYPKQTYASHVIGYTERDMKTARMGLESSLDDILRAEDGKISYQSDRKGIPLPNTSRHIIPAKDGYDVYLTIDSNIQMALEQVLTKVEEQYNPNKIIAIVADPKTGAILAMSNRPSFNPNEYEHITNYINYAISDRFEPGSTMKMFTVAAAMEEGVYNGKELYKSGQYKIGPDTISDHNYGLGWGEISFDDGFLRSSNVAMSILALEKLKPERFYQYWERFGFMEPTGIDLPNEATSLIANSYPIDAATTSFGQATAVTPIQQVQAAMAIANNGKMMKPYVIDRIVNPETGTVVQKTEPEVAGEPISKETAVKMRELLRQVVTAPSGTGKAYNIEGFEIIGKTGTAQIPNPNGRGYLRGHGQNIFSFLGMAPKDDPRVVVYVAVDRPQLEEHEAGSEPTVMIFNTVMKQSLQYLNITPTIEEAEMEREENGFVMKDYTNKSVSEVKQLLEREGVDVFVLGSGNTIEGQMPLSGKGLLPDEKVFLRTSGDAVMPNMIGWSMRDVRKFATVMDMRPTIFGHGYVTKQSIAPSSIIQEGDFVVIELEELKPPPLIDEEQLEDEELKDEEGNEEEEERNGE